MKIGDLSRGGYDRNIEAPKALDHDYQSQATLVPFGILDVLGEQLWIYFGQSKETTDFVVDCLEQWWKDNGDGYEGIEELMIELDGAGQIRSNRTQFIQRIVAFSQQNNLKIRLIYHPPYHSKYNTIERCWACLENYWRGAVLDSREAAIAWAKNMTWKGVKPIVELVEKTYQSGIVPSVEELETSKQSWHPCPKLPCWDISIMPQV